jgi:hypothetical protein
MIALSSKVPARLQMDQGDSDEENDDQNVNVEAIFSEMFHPKRWSDLGRGKTRDDLANTATQAIKETANGSGFMHVAISPVHDLENSRISCSEMGSNYLQHICEADNADTLFVIQAYREAGSLFTIDAGSLPDAEAEALSLAMAGGKAFSIETPHSIRSWCNRLGKYFVGDGDNLFAGNTDQLIKVFPWLQAGANDNQPKDPDDYFMMSSTELLLGIIVNPEMSGRTKDLARRVLKVAAAADSMFTISSDWWQSLMAAAVFDKDKMVECCLDDIEETDEENDGLMAAVEASQIIPFMRAFARHEQALMEIRKWK